MNNILQFLRSKIFFINLAVAVAVIILIFGFTYKWLDNYTKHGESISVPDLRGLQINKVDSMISNMHIHSAVVDSVYLPELPSGAITEQDPAPGSKVKENRTIYVTINSGVPAKVQMPNLIDVSLRQAQAILQTYGLKTGEFIYRADLAKNAVLEQKFHGREIKAGTMVNKGSVIDLVLGDGLGASKVPVPELTGLTRNEALFVLKGSSLNIGAIIYDANVRDSSSAKIYRQFPLHSDSATVSQGEAIDIYLTQ